MGVKRHISLPPALLPNLGRSPRILIVGESILNSFYIASRIATAYPGAVVDRRTYGGSQTPLGWLLTAGDVQAYAQAGNLLKNGNPTNWQFKTSCTVVASTSPATGLALPLITTTGVSGQRVTTGNGEGVVVPAGAPNMVVSLEVEPGTLSSFRVLVYNATKAGNIVTNDFTAAASNVADRANLPARYLVRIKASQGATYVDGDVLHIYLYIAQDNAIAGTIYAGNVMVNQGDMPAQFHATSGTAEAASAAAWLTPTPGTRRDLFDLAVIQFGRNDPGVLSAIEHERSTSAIISGFARLAARVLVCTPPPTAAADLLSWAATDTFVTLKLADAQKRAAYRHGAMFYDAVADFKAHVASGAHTIAQIMRDTLHPTDADTTSPGMGLYVSAILTALRSTFDRPVRPLVAAPCARLGGAVASGTWTWTEFTSSTQPGYDIMGMHIGYQKNSSVAAYVSSTAGHSLTFSMPACTAIGLIALADSAAAGVVSVSVDGRAAVNVTIGPVSGQSYYGHGFFVQGDLPNEAHTVVVTVVSGQARIVGVVGA